MHRSLCICALLPRLETRTRVVLLLHQLEVVKPTNTGVVAARCLPNSAVVYRGRAPDATEGTGPDLDEQAALLAAAVPAGARAAFLFPHVQAISLAAWRASAGDAPLALIVPDGTWRQAAHAYARMRGRGDVADWPCVKLSDPRVAETGGRLRVATRPGRLATLEALALALGELEGAAVEAALLHVFRVMTDRTLWSNGRLDGAAVTGGVPEGARSHDPLGQSAPPDRRTRAAP
jgi:DTW domain-containing protein YfiP